MFACLLKRDAAAWKTPKPVGTGACEGPRSGRVPNSNEFINIPTYPRYLSSHTSFAS